MGFHPSQSDRQAAADGNQYIFATIGPTTAAFLDAFPEGAPITRHRVDRFFNESRLPGERRIFVDGTADLRDAFLFYTSAMAETDPVRRQQLTFSGNLAAATFEQAGAQRWIEQLLDLSLSDGPRGLLEPLTPILGGDDVFATTFLDLPIGVGADGAGRRRLELERDVVPGDQTNNSLIGTAMTDLDPTAAAVRVLPVGDFSVDRDGRRGEVNLSPLGGWGDPSPDSGMRAFPVEVAGWWAGGEGNTLAVPGGVVEESTGSGDGLNLGGTGAIRWNDWEDRQWFIANFFHQYHTDPVIRDAGGLRAGSGRPLGGRGAARVSAVRSGRRPGRWFVMLGLWLAAGLAGAGCTGDSDDGFAVGRETAPVWLVEPAPMEDDGDAELALLADVFDWEFTDREYLVARGGNGEQFKQRGFDAGDEGGLFVYPIEGTWTQSGRGHIRNQWCNGCGAVPIGADEAAERLKVMLVDLGLDPASFVYESYVDENDDGVPAIAYAYALLTIDGYVTSLRWSMTFGDSDGRLLAAQGRFVETSVLGEVPLLTSEEAVAGAGPGPVDGAAAEAELAYETSFDRETGNLWMIPVYMVPISREIDLEVSVSATRPQDLASLAD